MIMRYLFMSLACTLVMLSASPGLAEDPVHRDPNIAYQEQQKELNDMVLETYKEIVALRKEWDSAHPSTRGDEQKTMSEHTNDTLRDIEARQSDREQKMKDLEMKKSELKIKVTEVTGSLPEWWNTNEKELYKRKDDVLRSYLSK